MLYNKKQSTLRLEDVEPAITYIDGYWKTLTRKAERRKSTLIPLPNPYVVPSPGNNSFGFEEQYYWDSYFTALGIDDEKVVCGMLDNLLYLLDTFGMIPNGNRYYFTSRSQPPILTSFIFHVYDKYGKPKSWLKTHMVAAKKEYETVWTATEHPHTRKVYKGLSRYYDINYLHDLAEAESGWDMTPRFKRQCLDYLPVDLNCLLYKYEADFARASHILGDESEERIWHYAAEERRKTVTNLLWNSRQKFFFDYNFTDKEQGKVWSLAAYYALWSGLATDEQARQLVNKLERFQKKGGLTTTIGNYMYHSLFGSAKTQWAYPNGWAPLHYIVIEGLENYGYSVQASTIAYTWLNNGYSWFVEHGEFLEKYNVVNPELKPAEGLYPSQTGFGWTNAIFKYLSLKYLK